MELTAIEQSAEFEELQQTLHDIAEENSRNISIAYIATTKPLNQVIFHELTPRPSCPSQKTMEPFEITGDFTDGTFIGIGDGFCDEIHVKIVFSENMVTDISVIFAVLQEQSPNVDILSGATHSSVGLFTAIVDAMRQALYKYEEIMDGFMPKTHRHGIIISTFIYEFMSKYRKETLTKKFLFRHEEGALVYWGEKNLTL